MSKKRLEPGLIKMPTLKIRPYLTLLVLAVFLAALNPAASYCEDVTETLFKEDVPVEVTADHLTYDKESNTFFATGNVLIVRGNTTITSDIAVLDKTAGVATASGHVTLVDEGGNTLNSDNLRVNLDDKTMVIANGRLFFRKDNVHVTGDVIKKTGPQTYDANKAIYTPCDCEKDESPAWSFSARKADITRGEYLTGTSSYFNVKDTPVLYTPYLSVPIKNGRQTGFLTPKPGYSRLRGFIFDDDFFWAISKNTDATISLDNESARGIGEGGEYRYIRTRRSYGQINYFHFHEYDINRIREARGGLSNLSRPATATDNRWELKLNHVEALPAGFNFKAKIDLVSDDEYFIDFGKTGKERSLESLESNLSLSKSWATYSLVAQLRYFDNLLLQDKTTTLQKLPEVTLNSSNQRIYETPFYLSLESSFVNFWREAGIRGQRVDLHPRLSLPMHPGGYFDFTPSIAPRATFYEVTDDPLGRYFDRYIYDIKVDATTTFVRIFDTEYDSLKAVKHTVRPKLTYVYVPKKDQSSLPSFDAVDNLPWTSAVTYSLNTILTGRREDEDGKKAYLDYVYLDVSQTYNIIEATRTIGPGVQRRPFSDIGTEVILKPSVWAKLSGKAQYNVYERWYDSYDSSVGLNDKRGDNLNLTHRYVRNVTRYSEAVAKIKTVPTVDLSLTERYSFDQHRSLETTYGLEYKHQCYGLLLTYSQKLEDKIVFLTFTLKGLGKVAALEGRVD